MLILISAFVNTESKLKITTFLIGDVLSGNTAHKIDEFTHFNQNWTQGDRNTSPHPTWLDPLPSEQT